MIIKRKWGEIPTVRSEPPAAGIQREPLHLIRAIRGGKRTRFSSELANRQNYTQNWQSPAAGAGRGQRCEGVAAERKPPLCCLLADGLGFGEAQARTLGDCIKRHENGPLNTLIGLIITHMAAA